MTELTTEQLIYLLYAKAYAKAEEADTLTKSDLKSSLPSEHKENAEKIYRDLKQNGLITPKTKDGKTKDKKEEPIKDTGRFSITGAGNEVLITNLTTTDYDLASSKSYKMLSTVLTCLLPLIKKTDGMTFDEFQEQFKALYFKERKQQSLKGVVAIRRREISQAFIEQHSISQQEFEKYFEMLRSKGEISVTEGGEDELIEWVE